MLQTLAGDLRESPGTELLTGHVLGSYRGRWDTLVQLMAMRLQEGYTVLITAASLTQDHHIQDLLREAELAAEVLTTPPDLLTAIGPASPPTFSPSHAARVATSTTAPSPSGLLVCVGSLSSGFVLPAARLMCVDAGEMWGTRRSRDRGPRPSARARLFNYRDLNPGDHIVHLDYGIGL